MESRTKILISVISSLAVSLVIAITAFSILKGMNTELRQGPLYDDIIGKTHALSILTASFYQGSGQSDVSQVKGILRSLDNLLNKIPSQVPGEEVLVRHLQRNNRELGPLIDQLLFSGREMTDHLEKERRNILISQVWMKVRFITDDTNRLRNMSQARMIAAQEKAGAVVIALIIILALTNGGIYYFSGRSIMRAQKALRESEERYRLAQQAAGLGSFEWNVRTGVSTWTPEMEAMYGLETGSFSRTQTSWEQLVHPDDRDMALALVNKAFSTGVPVEGEWRIIWPDGTIRWICGRFQVFSDRTGEPLRLTGVNIDITERKVAEDALRHSERLYRAIGESINYGIWTCAPDGRNTYASESFLKMVGITQEQCSNFGWGDLLHPHDAENTIVAWKECVRTEGIWDIEHRFRGTDGQWHPVLARGVPVRNDRGELICWAGINLDVGRMKRAEEALQSAKEDLEFRVAERTRDLAATLGVLSVEIAERQRAEELLRQSEERYRQVVEGQTEIICRFKADGTFTFVNDVYCRIFGKTSEELIGGKWQPEAFPDDVPIIEEQLRTMSPSNPVVVIENRIYSGSGEIRWMQFVNRGFFDKEGLMIETQAVGRDITDRKLAEKEMLQALEAAEAANSTMNRLVRTIAHEFRTPLGLLTGSTDILDRYRDRLSPEKRLEQHEQIRNAALQISNLVDSVTTYQLSKADRDKVSSRMQDVGDLCRTIAAEVETVWSLGHKFVVSIAPECGSAAIDDILFRRVLQNLLVNAFRYTKPEGTVSLHIHREKNELLLEVTDTGIGIPNEDKGLIFDAFYRSGNVAGRRGLGLGLSIVKEALSLLDGSITVTSSLGVGTTMGVVIPLHDQKVFQP